MPKLKIQTGADNEILRTRSAEVKNMTAKTPRLGLRLGELAKGMKKVLNDQKGLGLAAPQVGENVRVILVRMNSGSDHEMIFVMVNPEIIERSWEGMKVTGKVKKSGGVVGMVGSSEIGNLGKKLEEGSGAHGATEVALGAGVAEEGCLSLPGYYVNVIRASEITVRFLDGKGLLKGSVSGLGSGGRVAGGGHGGVPMLLELSGLNARVVQHEVDHLNGVLICDIVSE